MKSINNWKRKVIIITVKHSIVKIVTSFECYYLEKCGILFNLVILEGGGGNSGNQNGIYFFFYLERGFLLS